MGHKSPLPRLDDILLQLGNIDRFLDARSLNGFCTDDMARMAVERAFEIISEAVRHIPQKHLDRFPEIPWREIKAIGNILRHDYQRVDAEVIWKTAKQDLGPLKAVIQQIKDGEVAALQTAKTKTRIDERFAALKKEKRAALVTFISAGDPDLETSEKILMGLPKAGADIIELGMPFSDPMADGPAIQLSSQRALKGGQTMVKTLGLVRRFRAMDKETPIVLMGYYNPIYVYGNERFLKDAKDAGVDGLIVVDVPPEADDELCIPAMAHGLNFIRLATPTTDAKRLPAVLKNTSGFLYYVSITGITGAAAPVVNDVHKEVKRIKGETDLPVVVGFGVRTGEQAKAISKGADGVVVGSALVQAIEKSLNSKGEASPKTAAAVLGMVNELAAALKT